MSNINRPMDGFPDAFGSHRASVFPHSGPSSYAVVVLAAATTPSGGDLVNASEGGLKDIISLEGGLTDDGIFLVVPVPIGPSSTPQGAVAPGTSQWRLMWIANKTGAFGGQAQTFGTEAVVGTDLSAFTARLTAIGSKS